MLATGKLIMKDGKKSFRHDHFEYDQAKAQRWMLFKNAEALFQKLFDEAWTDHDLLANGYVDGHWPEIEDFVLTI